MSLKLTLFTNDAHARFTVPGALNVCTTLKASACASPGPPRGRELYTGRVSVATGSELAFNKRGGRGQPLAADFVGEHRIPSRAGIAIEGAQRCLRIGRRQVRLRRLAQLLPFAFGR
jgi:hypothetical protein